MHVYLDNAATANPKPAQMINEINHYLSIIGASPGRGSHLLSIKASDYVYSVRQLLAQLFSIQNPSNIIFSSNATHSLNIVIKGFLKKNDHALICSYSHNAVIRPLEALKKERDVSYDIFSIDKNDYLNIQEIENKIQSSTRLIICNHASNVIGVKSDLYSISKLSKKYNIPILLDATQTAGIIEENYQDLDLDFIAGTGHKTLLGPSGIGYLYIKNEDLITTFMEGGSSGNSSSSKSHPQYLPYKFEAGTLNYIGIAGLKGSLQELNRISFKKIYLHEKNLTEYTINKLKMFPEIIIYGTCDIEKKVPLISFNVNNILPSNICSILDKKYNITTRSGLHCAPYCHKSIGTYPQGTLRVSFQYKNTIQEIDYFINNLKKVLHP